VQVAGARWGVEECFQAGENEDHYQVRPYTAWYRHVTPARLAGAWLAITRAALPSPPGQGITRNAALSKAAQGANVAYLMHPTDPMIIDRRPVLLGHERRSSLRPAKLGVTAVAWITSAMQGACDDRATRVPNGLAQGPRRSAIAMIGGPLAVRGWQVPLGPHRSATMLLIER
jgi:hypothetical protein